VTNNEGDLFVKCCVFQLKRMKQIEQEKDVLMQGLQAVERAREWYLKQVAAVQEKMKYLGRMGSHMVSSVKHV
jgi:flagellar biosynthesis/type III secretory pathway chaperone